MKKSNDLVVSDLQLKKQSTHKRLQAGKEVHMYAVTFKIGQKAFAQTKHMTEAEADRFSPSIPVVQATKQRGLQKSLYKAVEGKVVYTEK